MLFFDFFSGFGRFLIILFQFLLGFVGLGQREWSVETRYENTNNENEQGEGNNDNAQNLVGLGGVTRVVSEDGLSIGVLGVGQVDKENDENLRDEMLHKKTPDEGNLADDSLHAIAEEQDVSKVNFPPHGFHSPLAIRSVHDLLDVDVGNSEACEVETKQTDETGPDGDARGESVPQNAAKDDSTKVGNLEGINDGRTLAFALSDDVVGPGTSVCFKESDQEHDEINVKVNCVKEDEAGVGSVHDGEEETDTRHTESEPEAGDLLEVDSIVHDGDEGLQKGKGGVNTQQEQVEEDQSDPVDATRELVEDDGPGSENEVESTVIQFGNGLSFQEGEMTEGGKDGETSNEGEHGVRQRNDGGIGDGGFIARAMASKGGQDTKGQSDGKEDLTAGNTPDFSLLGQDGHVPDSDVFLDTIRTSLEGQSLSEEDKEKDNGETHTDVGNSSRPLDAPGDTQKDDEPGQKGVADIFADEARGLHRVGDGLHSDNVVDEMADGFSTGQIGIGPGGVLREGVEEGVENPGDQDDVVGVEHETASDGSESDSSQARMESSKDTNITGLEILTESNFENGKRNSKKEESHEVGDKEGTSSVGDGETGESPNVSESNGGSDGRHVKGKTR